MQRELLDTRTWLTVQELASAIFEWIEACGATSACGETALTGDTPNDPTRIIGLVSLTMLLAARLRDLEEARDTDRILQTRIIRPRRRRSRTS